MNAFDVSRAVWRKSTRSAQNGGCVELSPLWRKSSRSAANGSCVELAPGVGVRDSKRPAQPALLVERARWATFARQVRTGAFDQG